jgi:hypothetical protein
MHSLLFLILLKGLFKQFTVFNLTERPVQAQFTVFNLTERPVQAQFTVFNLTERPVQAQFTVLNLTEEKYFTFPCNETFYKKK